jgi:hypothetical protein
MSFAAVYNVTRALRMLLHNELVKVSTSAVVTLLPPGDQLPAVSGLNLYLYRVLESPSTKNQPWPGDRQTPPSNQPALGLQLFYLMTPLGMRPDDNSFQLGDDGHTMLGAAMLTFQAYPILNDIHIPATASTPGFDSDTVLPSFLRNSYEKVKLMLMPMGLEELSKIWATINQPYRLSVAYEVSLVQLTPTLPPRVDAGIVIRPPIPTIIAWQPAQLSALVPHSGALVHIVAGKVTANQLIVEGYGLTIRGQDSVVTIAGRAVNIVSSSAPPNESFTITLPADIDAGPEADVVVLLAGRGSAPLPFTVTPWLSSITPIRTALDSTSPTDLSLLLTGMGFTNTPAAVRLEAPSGTTTVNSFAAGGSDTAVSITIPTGLGNGLYQVRLVVGDAASSATNMRTLQVIPLVRTPVGVSVAAGVHRLTINGARLNGTDVRIAIDNIIYQFGTNSTGNQLVYTLGKLLDVGQHKLVVNVDGQASRAVQFGV